MVELTIDGQRGRRARGRDAARRLPRRRHRHADALLSREPHAGERLPRLRRRGRRRARAGAGLLAQGRGRDGVQTDSERVRLSRKLVLELLASSVDLSTAPQSRATWSGTTPTPSASVRRAAGRAGERDAARPGHHHPRPTGARPPWRSR